MTVMLAAPQKGRKSSARRRRSKYLDDPEVLLMLRVQAGDDDAFAELVQRYRARVFGSFVKRMGDRQEAEDLTQEVFLRLYRSRHTYQPRARFGTWLFHVSQNVARNALRSRRRRPALRLEALTSPADPGAAEALLTDRGEAPSRRMERSELAGVVRAAVSALAGRQRAAVELHQFYDRTYAEVAEELDMTPKAAKSLLYRARNELREALGSFVEVV
jgi:RNA polymerase sigma-70 factor (ECF subfamily)